MEKKVNNKTFRFLSFVFSFALAVSIPFSAFAADYSSEFPSYVPVSGGAFIEIRTNDSTLGTCTLLFNIETENNTFGFTGSGSNICNITGSTVSGTVYTSSGASYSARFTSMSTLEYYYDSGSVYDREWRDVTVQEILNTNVEFTDLTGNDRGNIIDIFNRSAPIYVFFFLFLVSDLLLLVLVFRRAD